MGTEYNIQNITVDCLLEMIKKQNTAYRAGTPIVTDAVYDAEIEKLKELDPENEWFKHVEPSPVSTSRKRKLPLPMKSLNKVKDINELKKWFSSLGLHADTELILMPKFDGLSLLHNEQTGEGTGFMFDNLTPQAVYDTVGWAVYAYYNKKDHIRQMQKRAMEQDFTWTKSCRQYEKVYKEALLRGCGIKL